ncbi:MAG: glutamate formimidoyltransferase [Bacteroidia bacterium]|nr:glutamate formimidoyltransferase [Bacteroidia bacterium]
MEPVLLCTPNFSEGRKEDSIRAIINAVQEIKGVKVMAVDKGTTLNRTVIAFGGEPESVFQAAKVLYEVALKLIDMRQHKGSHPRIGAVDVCPFTPYRGIDKNWLKAQVERFAQEIADLFRLPVYLYADSARTEERKLLPAIRKGGYEKLAEKLKDPGWTPDFGPIVPNSRGGATVIGVRDFIAALNLTLTTRSETVAERIALKIRQSNGGLPHVQAKGWFLPELGFAQVSVNIINLREMPLHRVFEAVDEEARKQGVRITETEIVGILPEWALLEAAHYFLERAGDSPHDLTPKEMIDMAARSLMLRNFRPEERIPEWIFGPAELGPDLSEISLRELVWKLAQGENGVPFFVPVIIQATLALSMASRIAAGLPARHAFTHAEYMQLLQDTLLVLQGATCNIDQLKTLSKKVLRGFALLRQISEVLSADRKELLLVIAEIFSGAVESIAAAYASFQKDQPEIAQERHDIELQGRFFREEIVNRLKI